MKVTFDLEGVTVYVVSLDLPFAQGRWCGPEGVENVVTLSDYKDRNFGKSYGVFIEELALLTRAVFVVDEENKVTYAEYVKEVANQPDFDGVYNSLK